MEIATLLVGLATMIVPLAASAQMHRSNTADLSGGMPFSDGFSGKNLNQGWTVASRNADSSVALTGKGYLEIKASPLNGGSDLFNSTNYSAPVLLQPVSATSNWTVQTQINFAPTNNYQSAGVLLATQPGGFTAQSQYNRVAETAFYPDGGGNVVRCDNTTVIVAYNHPTTFYKVVKTGSAAKGWTYNVDYSPDGKTWTFCGTSAADKTAYGYVGLFAIRQPWDNNTQVYSVADFNYFKIHAKP